MFPKCGLQMSAEGCEVTVPTLGEPGEEAGLPGPGSLCRDPMGWTKMLRTPLLRGALRVKQVLLALVSGLGWALRSTYRTAWAAAPRCRCPSSYGASSGTSNRRALLGVAGLWWAVAPLMALWYSAGEVPTSANLNSYGGSGSCVRWHSNDEGLFWDCGDPKVIVSLSLGSSALFKWKPWPCSDGEEREFVLVAPWGLLVMDRRYQDGYLHCTDHRLGGERVNVNLPVDQEPCTSMSLGLRVVCCLPTCVKSSPVSTSASLAWPGLFLSVCLLVLLGCGLVFVALLISSWPGWLVRVWC